MVVDAFFYMFFVGAGTTLGAACVGLLSWKVWQRMNNQSVKKRKGVSF
jgi:high-affinity Fe2+/Pb2+ permease